MVSPEEGRLVGVDSWRKELEELDKLKEDAGAWLSKRSGR